MFSFHLVSALFARAPPRITFLVDELIKWHFLSLDLLILLLHLHCRFDECADWIMQKPNYATVNA